ncbi:MULTISPECIES: 23S rRNA (guanosine(2251)-2'-O)-methyltransferase RlmB [Streptomyces]|uniref:23S rRNA (guanosine(2251)-2'-O)-methyltransferase RlmB n=1 Tax=Streptomyces TaxID=1883 RepID=UPI00163C4FE8|nr:MULTISPECIES: 23S rRNA (guanosine(2251)-2'-O)-methyltransferase RlmB [Streptomyces]MBC2874960.1 23S rRNA (guanosine(2251)-2'-O)-methyltransferase RlmB [Streptomyces sp. TYQ1024]UBI37400.1 23S rRNA (guanosine(2251)-2'-O)-methyltransferase RlmB [Streptomyces mobaraensis]UKW29990.1 23S rRNA (guanosine(2251)-2'-O)-methyltransferase RlmB [Streptomyces sp. TYQ1024]
MAGNSQRRNRRTSNKKGATVGSGGQRRRGLEGKGPTPPAHMRKGHKKNRVANAAAKQAARRPAPRRGGPKGTNELVVGRNSVVEALREGVPATTLYVQQYLDNDERVREAIQLATEKGLNLMEAPRPELDRMTNGLNHQGLVLSVPPYDYAHPEDLTAAAQADGEDALIVALDGITDPRNLGAVVRSVSAFGGHGVVVPERRAAGMTASAWKTSAGTAARTPVARATNMTRMLEAYQKEGLMVVGLAADGDVELHELDALEGPVVIVVGSEGKGLSRLVGETCDFRVRIPMPGGAESLNAGVAAGVVLYEAARRRA